MSVSFRHNRRSLVLGSTNLRTRIGSKGENCILKIINMKILTEFKKIKRIF